MNQAFHRIVWNSVFVVWLCLSSAQVFAQNAQEEWKNLIDQHLVLMVQSQYERALDVALSALALAESSLSSDGEIEITLIHAARAYSALEQFNSALTLQQRALAISEKTHGQEHPSTVARLSDLGSTYLKLFQFDEAHEIVKRALAIGEKTFDPEDPKTASLLNNLGATFRFLGQFDQALRLHERALAIREKVLGPDHLQTAFSLSNLALTYKSLGQYERALPLQKRALAIREKVLGPEHLENTIFMDGLATIYISLGHYDQALSLQQQALAIHKKVLGPAHPKTAASLSELASTFSLLAQFEQALAFQQQALVIREKVLGQEHPGTAQSLGGLASIYISLGQYERALPLQKRVLAIHEKVFGPEHSSTSTSLNNLAFSYGGLGLDDQALPLLQRALAVREKAFGPDHPKTGVSLNNLAGTYVVLGQFDQALPLQERALLISERALGSDHPDIAAFLGNLAHTYIELGQFDQALPLKQRAFEISSESFGPKHPYTALGLANLADLYALMGQRSLAIAIYKAAVNSYQFQRDRISQIGSSELSSFTNSVSSTYQNVAELLILDGRMSEAQQVLDMLKEDEQFEFIRRSHDADPRRSRVGYTPTEQKWYDRYLQISDQLASFGAEERELAKLAKIGLSPEQRKRQVAIQSDLKVAQAAFTNFLGQMRESFTEQGPSRAVEVSEVSEKAASEMRTLIRSQGDGVTLLQYYVTDAQVGMLLTTPDVQLARSFKITTKDLNHQVEEFRRALREPKVDPLPMAMALYKVLLAPVESDLIQAGAKTVMLSLDGVLRYLPFGALHDGKQYAAKRWALPVYTSVVREKLRDSNVAKWQVAGFGVTRAIGGFHALPAVRSEMNSIVNTGNNAGLFPGEVYLDEAFTAQRLKQVGQSKFELLHVSSHFQFSPGTEVNSFLLLGDGQQLKLGDIRTQNYRFDNVDLLTLSACETGLGGGRDAKGKEIEGFGVIAQQQGAKAVLVTLWPVADQSTASLMADMYRRRQVQGLNKIEALRQAQAALMAQPRYSHPFYWAPFILMGNWR